MLHQMARFEDIFSFLYFFSQTFAFTARKWVEENSTYLTSLYYQTVEDAEPTSLTADQNFNVSEFAWDPTSTVIAFTRSDNKSVLYTIDISTSAIATAATFPVAISMLKWGKNGNIFTAFAP